MTRARGFTLIELAVAVAILAIGTIAAYRSFDQAQRGIGGQLARALAAEVALNRAAELRLPGAASLPGRVSLGGIDWRVTVEERATGAALTEATILVSAEGQPGARYVVVVPQAVR